MSYVWNYVRDKVSDAYTGAFNRLDPILGPNIPLYNQLSDERKAAVRRWASEKLSGLTIEEAVKYANSDEFRRSYVEWQDYIGSFVGRPTRAQVGQANARIYNFWDSFMNKLDDERKWPVRAVSVNRPGLMPQQSWHRALPPVLPVTAPRGRIKPSRSKKVVSFGEYRRVFCYVFIHL